MKAFRNSPKQNANLNSDFFSCHIRDKKGIVSNRITFRRKPPVVFQKPKRVQPKAYP